MSGKAQRDDRRQIDGRRVLRSIYRALATLITATLALAAIAAFFAATAGNGLLLVSMILAPLTLIVGSHLLNLDRLFERPQFDPPAEPADGAPIGARLAGRLGAALIPQLQVNWEIGSSQVHKLDLDAIARGQAMAAQGRSLDEISRSIEPDYASWSPPHQQAYQALLRAALDHSR